MMGGAGGKHYEGKVLTVPDTSCYPRPLQERVPVVLGGGGERRTLRLAARYADAANVFGDAATVAHKTAVLRAHCAAAGRDPAEVAMTHLSTTLVADSDRHLSAMVGRLRPRGRAGAKYAESVNAG